MKIDKVKTNEMVSMTQYMKIIGSTKDSLQVEDQNGMKFTIKGKELIENNLRSGSQFKEVKNVSRTQAVEVLTNAKDSVFTVAFEKVDGSERTLVGHLTDTENYFGRSNVIDLEVPKGERNVRQIDHRTISSLIINNVKYQVK